jgi:hypothetical protein
MNRGLHAAAGRSRRPALDLGAKALPFHTSTRFAYALNPVRFRTAQPERNAFDRFSEAPLDPCPTDCIRMQTRVRHLCVTRRRTS